MKNFFNHVINSIIKLRILTAVLAALIFAHWLVTDSKEKYTIENTHELEEQSSLAKKREILLPKHPFGLDNLSMAEIKSRVNYDEKVSISNWPIDVISIYKESNNTINTITGQAIASYTTGRKSLPHIINYLIEPYGKKQVVGQMMVSDNLSEKSVSEVNEIISIYTGYFAKQGYVIDEVKTFASHPIRNRNIDSNSLYLDEKGIAYEIHLRKKAPKLNAKEIPKNERIIIFKNPAIEKGILKFKNIGIFYARTYMDI